MGFSPQLVGLPNEHISGNFGEPRPGANCPHRGMDISNSAGGGAPQPFNAGIYGLVVGPAWSSSAWGSISIQPFSDLSTVVQYLHASQCNVSVGDKVAPWTVLGLTGNTSPLNPPLPIHLHIQVVEPGNPTQTCWDRNYVDPATWDTTSPLIGSWTGSSSTPGTIQNDNLTVNTDASSGTIGSLVQHAQMTISQYQIDVTYTGGIEATGYGPKDELQIATVGTTATVTSSNYPGPVNLGPIQELVGALTLDSSTGVSVTWSGGRLELFNRVGAAALLEGVSGLSENPLIIWRRGHIVEVRSQMESGSH